jgi:hypothetical protein
MEGHRMHIEIRCENIVENAKLVEGQDKSITVRWTEVR